MIFGSQMNKSPIVKEASISRQANKVLMVEDRTFTHSGPLRYKDLSKTYEIKETEILLSDLLVDNVRQDLSLIGVDSIGYYFKLIETNGALKFFFYETETETIRYVRVDSGMYDIYNIIYHNGEVFIISKATSGSNNGGAVIISKIDFDKKQVDVIYKDDGTKYLVFSVFNDNFVILNAYMAENDFTEYRITIIKLENGDSKIIASVQKNQTAMGFEGEEIVRVGGMDNTLYAEFGEFDREQEKEVYYVKKIDLLTGMIEIIDIQNPVDYISGDFAMLVTRQYATGKAISSEAVSVYVWNSESEQYNQYTIADSDSFKHPYDLKVIEPFYILLQTYDIKVIDRENLVYDTITYRRRNSAGPTEYISRPFIVDKSIYLMRFDDNTSPTKVTITQYEFDEEAPVM